MAGKENSSPSDIDKTSFFWTGMCGICHPGGGPSEFDRDGLPYYDTELEAFGYEFLGKSPADVALDGDYSVVNTMTGAIGPAPWHVTGVSEPDCMYCHRDDLTINSGKNMNWVWRAATLRGREGLVDLTGDSVPAYLAASTAGQGWFSHMEMAALPPGNPPLATTLQIDYQVGLDDGSLVVGDDNRLRLAGDHITPEPKDMACWGCHVTPDLKKRGMVWFQADHDVHYAAFTNRNDDDPTNDIDPEDSTACSRCHPTGLDHDIAKGNAFLGSVRNVTDYHEMRTCADCHLEDSPTRDEEAPIPSSLIHTITPTHLESMSCEFCHIPSHDNPAQLVVDNSVTGASVAYNTDTFLSADPLDPSDPDTSIWWPGARWKVSDDGGVRLYPTKPLLSVWWGDWNQNGTPADLSDDVIEPVILWRLRQITAGQPLPGVTDDNGDGRPEVNRFEEIATYLEALTQNDSHGNPVATNPVLVKGDRVYFAEPSAPFGVGWIEHHGTGMQVESEHPFSIDHNVLPASQALGVDLSCSTCHIAFGPGDPTPVFERLILVDPFDENGDPVYRTLREVSGADPP